LRAAAYFSSRRFIFCIAGQTYASSFANAFSSTVSPADATRARTRSIKAAGTCASSHAEASSGTCVCASSGERSNVM
jgi:hypothetical protein